MIITYDENGEVYSIQGFREGVTREKIDRLNAIDGYENIRLYDQIAIDRVWMAIDTGGAISVVDGYVVTENGEGEPRVIKEESSRLYTPPIDQLAIEVSQREINEIVQGRQLADLEIRLLMGGL